MSIFAVFGYVNVHKGSLMTKYSYVLLIYTKYVFLRYNDGKIAQFIVIFKKMTGFQKK